MQVSVEPLRPGRNKKAQISPLRAADHRDQQGPAAEPAAPPVRHDNPHRCPTLRSSCHASSSRVQLRLQSCYSKRKKKKKKKKATHARPFLLTNIERQRRDEFAEEEERREFRLERKSHLPSSGWSRKPRAQQHRVAPSEPSASNLRVSGHL